MPASGDRSPSATSDDVGMHRRHQGVDLEDGLTIVANGPTTNGGRISLSELARIASSFQATLERIALSVIGARPKMGRRPQEIAQAVQLDFVGFREGSAKMLLERLSVRAFDDLLADSVDALITGLEEVSENPMSSPRHFTTSVVNGLVRLAGGISRDNLHSITFLSGGKTELFLIDNKLQAQLKILQKRTLHEETTVVGRLHMGDFDPMSLRCRIDTYAGSISCEFDDDLRGRVFDLMDEIVMASGVAELQADRSTIRVLHLADLEAVATASTPSLDDLARQHHAVPVGNLSDLRGEVVEGFDEFFEIVKSARG